MSSHAPTGTPAPGNTPILSVLLEDTFGIPTDVTFKIMRSKNFEQQGVEQNDEILVGEVKVHKIILGLFSPVFKGEFYGPVKERKDVIAVRQTSLESFEIMVDYMYSKTINWGKLSVEEMYDVVNLAEKYHIPKLTEEVKTQMENVVLTVDNILHIAETAEQFTQFPSVSSNLLLVCAKFLKSTFHTDGELLKFATDQAGQGQEATVLRLLSLTKEIQPAVCLNCGETECKDGKPIRTLDELEGKARASGMKMKLNGGNITIDRPIKTYLLSSVNLADITVITSTNTKETHKLIHTGRPQFLYKCT